MDILKEQLQEYNLDYFSINKLFGEGKVIKVPSKVPSKLNYILKKDLQIIHEDIKTAKELILIISSNLSSTYTISLQHNDTRKKLGYKKLNARLLESQVKYSYKKTSPYKKIINLLIDLEIIEKGKKHLAGDRSTEYRLTDKYFGKGIVNYTLESYDAIRLNSRYLSKQLLEATSTVLGRNSLNLYSSVDLLPIDEVKEILEQVIKDGYINKKGKRLVKLGKNVSRYPREDYVYFEEYLESYEFLTDGFLIPIVTDEKAGHRVIDSFNLMPSIIRKHLLINGEPITEVDYSCLHPNIANRIYRGEDNSQIKHEDAADYLGISRKEAKIEHLSFFNKGVKAMEDSPLYKYYYDNRRDLLFAVENDKIRHECKKVTSQKMFDLETQLMSSVVSKLSGEGINVMYVFDALYVAEKDKKKVQSIMNKTAEEFKINTEVG